MKKSLAFHQKQIQVSSKQPITVGFQTEHCLLNGGLAQLARALAWHARGHRFDSGILHNYTKPLVFTGGLVLTVTI